MKSRATAVRRLVRNGPIEITGRRPELRGGVTAAFLVAAALAVASGPRPISAADGMRVNIKDFAFGPTTLTIAAGERVTWANDDSVPHTATSADNSWDTGQLQPGHSTTITFTRPGTYAYHCAVHPFMQAKVVVTP